ncbi:ATP-binding protein, partial [Streptomyces sp. NPDC055721]
MIDTDGDCAEWNFPAEANAVRTARHAVRETLWSGDPDAARGDVTV